MGLPSIAFVLAENQRAIVKGLDEAGVLHGIEKDFLSYGDFVAGVLRQLILDPVRRGEMSRQGRGLVGGQGAIEVIAALS